MDSLLQFDNLEDRLTELNKDYSSDQNNNDFKNTLVSKEDKYSLRPRSIRRVTETLIKHVESSKREKSKHKQKPAPLSKYRRKTANARERNRMREINQAFETLRRVVPHISSNQVPTTANEKLTKITTLRLAMKYIATLKGILNNSDSNSESVSDYSDLDYLWFESDGDSLTVSDNSLLASPDFPEPSLSPVDFADPSLPSLLHTDFSDLRLEASDFGDLLLT